MEAASRPPLELLPDEPADASAPRKGPSAPGAASVQPATAPSDTGQTGLNFIDPEMFLAAGEAASTAPVASNGAGAPRTDPSAELVLEDPVVDEVLTAPPAPAPVAPAVKAAPSPKASAEPAASAAAVRAAARVPLAKTASLAAAATKLAAASAANRSPAKPKPTATVSPGTRPAATVAAATTAAAKPMPASPTASAGAAPTPRAAAQPAAKVEAPTLASWASARAAATPPKVGAPAPAPSVASAAAGPARSAPPKSVPHVTHPAPAPLAPAPAAATAPAATAATAATASAVGAAPVMDRDFIARNQVVERYLSGRLPIKSATEFERFCRAHPELLDEIGLPEKVNAGLRLLEASGKPEPWQEAPRPAWQRPEVTLALAAAVAVLGIALAVVGGGSASKSRHIADLQKQASERALDPATRTREIRLLPSRSGASNSPAITIGEVGSTQLADMKIDESRSPYHTFRVTIDRIDQGRVGIINNLGKDSNGHLRIALNTSALGPGNYLFTLEGLDWRGAPQPDSWVTIGIQH